MHKELIEWKKKVGKNIFKDMKISKNAIVVDFGCGYGEYTISASKYLTNGKVYAIDCDKKSLDIVRKKLIEYKITNVEIIQNEKKSITPLENEVADILLLYDIIHGCYIETKLPIRFDIYPEANRILKQNGILSSLTPCRIS